jgi:hypothetical protein
MKIEDYPRIVQTYCDWACEYNIWTEKVRRVSLLQEDRRVHIQVVVLDSIDEFHMDDIYAVNGHIAAHITDNCEFDESIVRITDDRKLVDIPALPIRVFQQAVRNVSQER